MDMPGEVRLNAAEMDTRENAHAHLAARLALPAYYGRNLDALYDCLGDVSAPLSITLAPARLLYQNLGGYGTLLLQVLEDAAKRNPRLTLHIEY